MGDLLNSFSAYKKAYAESVENPEQFWAERAADFEWSNAWDKTLDWNFETPNVQWFIGGKTNITINCLDRHLTNRADQQAIIWESNDPKEATQYYTYRQLHEQVCKLANVLKKNNIQKGDRVCIYMPMVPQLAMAVLACARIGAIHSVVFAGFSASSLSDRINDASCKMVLTTDAAYRGAKVIPVKNVVDEALETCSSVETVIVLNRVGWSVNMQAGRDKDWEKELVGISSDCPAEAMDAEDPLFILYTSGSTGKPKGVVHTCGGYMVYAGYTFKQVFQYQEGEIFWCTADIGWITGHSYIVYGTLLNGASTLMFEGIPTFPDPGRFWQIIDKHRVNIFYTAPTAIRSLMALGVDHVLPYSLHTLRVLGSVGEPINEEAWHWYHIHIGKEKCPIVDTWWQTETGGIMISSLAGVTPSIPSFAGFPMPGIQTILVDTNGNELTEPEAEGLLCIKFPWPGVLRTTWGDHERCRQNYFSSFKNLYFTGDGARRNEQGMYRIIGRVDDVINVSGHRLGTAEVENAINQHKHIVESAVVGFPHAIKGQGIYAYVIAGGDAPDDVSLKNEVIEVVAKEIGPIAKPDKIQVVSGLPKTRSGKIMRRILRKIAEGEISQLGDTSTLLDPTVVDEIIKGRL
jgi:acetyl-CoA synthetase